MARDMTGDDSDDFFAATDDHDGEGGQEPQDEDLDLGEGEQDEAPTEEKKPDADQSPDDLQAAPQRKSRGERRRERAEGFANQLKSANERAANLEAQLAEMAAQVAASARASQTVADAVARGSERPRETPVEAAQRKLIEAASRVNDDDPKSAARFLREQVEINSELYRAQQVEEMERFRQTLPQPDPPHLRALYAKAEWLRDQAHAAAVAAKKAGLVNARGMNPRTMSPQMHEQLANQAIAEYGAFMGLPVNLPARQPANPGAVAGAGSRSFSGSAGTRQQMQITPVMRRLADVDPNFKHLPQAKRYVEYAKMVQRELKNDSAARP